MFLFFILLKMYRSKLNINITKEMNHRNLWIRRTVLNFMEHTISYFILNRGSGAICLVNKKSVWMENFKKWPCQSFLGNLFHNCFRNSPGNCRSAQFSTLQMECLDFLKFLLQFSQNLVQGHSIQKDEITCGWNVTNIIWNNYISRSFSFMSKCKLIDFSNFYLSIKTYIKNWYKIKISCTYLKFQLGLFVLGM